MGLSHKRPNTHSSGVICSNIYDTFDSVGEGATSTVKIEGRNEGTKESNDLTSKSAGSKNTKNTGDQQGPPKEKKEPTVPPTPSRQPKDSATKPPKKSPREWENVDFLIQNPPRARSRLWWSRKRKSSRPGTCFVRLVMRKWGVYSAASFKNGVQWCPQPLLYWFRSSAALCRKRLFTRLIAWCRNVKNIRRRCPDLIPTRIHTMQGSVRMIATLLTIKR